MFYNNFLPSVIRPAILAEIKQQAVDRYPHEAVWFVYSDGVEEVENVADEASETFSVSPATVAAAYGRGLLGIIHSHCNAPAFPSVADMEGQKRTNVPWGVVATNGISCSDIVWWGLETPAPLKGRPFIHGIYDCFSLVRDYYIVNHQLKVEDVPRSWPWFESEQDLISEHYADRGFREVPFTEIQKGDGLLFNFKRDKITHVGIFTGNGTFLHHPGGQCSVDPTRLSVESDLARYLPHLAKVVRHKSLFEVKNV